MPAAPVHHTPVDKTGSWDGSAQEKKFDKKAGEFPAFYAWIDKAGDADGTDKEDGWGPHHDVNADGTPGDANLAGVEAAMAALNGAHGGNSVIPDGDRQGVWDHLAAHYEDAGTAKADVPELKSASDDRSRRPRGSRELVLQAKCRRNFANGRFIEIRKGVTDPKTGNPDMVELSGQVIGYDKPYEVNDMFGTFTETIHYGAATALLSDPALDVCFLVGHDASLVPLARTGAKASLTLTDTKEGLQIRALLDPRMTGANDLIVGLENGTISQMSVGMQVDPAGDVWSGEDDYGMPNQRDIYRLANIFDASAVAFPANPETDLELASARMAEFPPELTVRAQKLYDLAKRGRQGLITQDESDILLNVVRHLFVAERNAPTPQDGAVTKAITVAHQATAAALAAQAKDPDNNTDPVDKKVWNSLTAAHSALTDALGHQAKDGTPDNVVADNADGSSVSGPGNAPGIGNEDGSGSRSRLIDIDSDLARLRRRRAS